MKFYGYIFLFSFTVHLTLLNGQQTTFAVIGDFGYGHTTETAVANQLKSWDPQFVITTGDNRYNGTYDLTIGKDFCEFLAGAEPGYYCDGKGSALNAFFPSTGNHDYTNEGGINEYTSYFDLPGAGIQSSGTSGSELYYDFVVDKIHFFVIDSYSALSDGTMTAQQIWLQNQMTVSTARWKIVYFHHPPYSSGETHGSSLEMRWPFAQWGADAVLNGHDHLYERLSYDSIVYFVNGLGGNNYRTFAEPLPGSIVRYSAEPGAQYVVVDDTSMTFSFINIYGDTIDEYAIMKEKPANLDPVFSSDTISETAATEDSTYLNSISGYATDPDGDSLYYAIISGPDWLSMAPDGTLSGTPLSEDVGLNSWMIKVEDESSGADSATLQITVLSSNQDTATTAYSIPKARLIVYPNPASDRLIVVAVGWQGEKNLTLFNILGEVVYTVSMMADKIEIDVSILSKGIYILELSNGKQNNMKEIVIH